MRLRTLFGPPSKSCADPWGFGLSMTPLQVYVRSHGVSGFLWPSFLFMWRSMRFWALFDFLSNLCQGPWGFVSPWQPLKIRRGTWGFGRIVIRCDGRRETEKPNFNSAYRLLGTKWTNLQFGFSASWRPKEPNCNSVSRRLGAPMSQIVIRLLGVSQINQLRFPGSPRSVYIHVLIHILHNVYMI